MKNNIEEKENKPKKMERSDNRRTETRKQIGGEEKRKINKKDNKRKQER